MFGWYRRYKELERENKKYEELVDLQQQLIDQQNEYVTRRGELFATTEKELSMARTLLKATETQNDLVLTLLAQCIYDGRDPRATIGKIFKSLSPETCRRVAERLLKRKE